MKTLVKVTKQGDSFLATWNDNSQSLLTWGEYQKALHGNFDVNAALRFRD